MLSVDRIEGGSAVVVDEYGHVMNIPGNMIDGDFREGDILIEHGGRYTADPDSTEKRRQYIRELERSLWE